MKGSLSSDFLLGVGALGPASGALGVQEAHPCWLPNTFVSRSTFLIVIFSGVLLGPRIKKQLFKNLVILLSLLEVLILSFFTWKIEVLLITLAILITVLIYSINIYCEPNPVLGMSHE